MQGCLTGSPLPHFSLCHRAWLKADARMVSALYRSRDKVWADVLRGMQKLAPVKFISSVAEGTGALRDPLLAAGVRIQTRH